MFQFELFAFDYEQKLIIDNQFGLCRYNVADVPLVENCFCILVSHSA